MGKKRFALRVVKAKIEGNILGILKSTPTELEECQTLLRNYVTGKERADARSRLMAAREKLMLAKDIVMYENPQVQKSEMMINGLPEVPRELVVTVVKPGQEKKRGK
jgi:hypothetical protein